jgi:hypothetical protein
MLERIAVLFFMLFLTLPVNAQSSYDDDDALKPAKRGDAIAQYNALWDMKDPTAYLQKEVTWKLYVQRIITPMNGYSKSPEWLLAGLTKDEDHYVYIPINHLYNSMSVLPKIHQWIIVRGRIVRKGRYTIWHWSKGERRDLDAFYLDPEESVLSHKTVEK